VLVWIPANRSEFKYWPVRYQRHHDWEIFVHAVLSCDAKCRDFPSCFFILKSARRNNQGKIFAERAVKQLSCVCNVPSYFHIFSLIEKVSVTRLSGNDPKKSRIQFRRKSLGATCPQALTLLHGRGGLVPCPSDITLHARKPPLACFVAFYHSRQPP
jgi:hypothetical protein